MLVGWLILDRGLTSREAWQQQFDVWLQSAGIDIQTTNQTQNKATQVKSQPSNIYLSVPEAEPEPLPLAPPETTITPQLEALPDPLPQTLPAQLPEAEPAPEIQLQIEQPLPDSPLLESSTATIEPLENPIEPVPVPPSTLQISFDFDSASLSENAKERLDELASTFTRSGNGRILATGYADERGDRYYNLALSRRRADVVARYLVASGVDEDHLSVQGLGIYSEANRAPSDETASSGINGRIVELEIEFDPPGR